MRGTNFKPAMNELKSRTYLAKKYVPRYPHAG